MSALAHNFEEEGVPAVTVSLIRLHSEKIGPPRALWVPFELGRPLGAPKDEQFQICVITAALRLLETAPGPAVLEDFPDDDPTANDLPGWRPPGDFTAGAIDIGERETLERALRQEVLAIAPFHERFVAANRRTAIGLSRLSIDDCARLLAAGLAGTLPVSPRSVGEPGTGAALGRRRPESVLSRGDVGGWHHAVKPADAELVLGSDARGPRYHCLTPATARKRR